MKHLIPLIPLLTLLLAHSIEASNPAPTVGEQAKTILNNNLRLFQQTRDALALAQKSTTPQTAKLVAQNVIAAQKKIHDTLLSLQKAATQGSAKKLKLDGLFHLPLSHKEPGGSIAEKAKALTDQNIDVLTSLANQLSQAVPHDTTITADIAQAQLQIEDHLKTMAQEVIKHLPANPFKRRVVMTTLPLKKSTAQS